MPDGQPASNARLVEKVTTLARGIGRETASPDEARTTLSLNPAWKNRIIDLREDRITAPVSSNT